MRPDQDKRLLEMGKGNDTCSKCMNQLYSSVDDEICDDCNLNPLKSGTENLNQFIGDALKEAQEKSELCYICGGKQDVRNRICEPCETAIHSMCNRFFENKTPAAEFNVKLNGDWDWEVAKLPLKNYVTVKKEY